MARICRLPGMAFTARESMLSSSSCDGLAGMLYLCDDLQIPHIRSKEDVAGFHLHKIPQVRSGILYLWLFRKLSGFLLF